MLFDFLEKFRKAINILLHDKIVFQKYKDTGYHKFFLTKHNTIIYNYKDDELPIYRILQNFQNPEDNYGSLTCEEDPVCFIFIISTGSPNFAYI